MLKKLQTFSFYSVLGGTFLLAPFDTPVHRFINDYKVQAYEGFRPYLCKMLDAENVYVLEYYLLMSNLLGKPKVDYNKNLELELPGGRKVRNPLCLAAGYDRNGRALENLFELGFGGVEVGSVTLDQERTELKLKYDFKHEEVRAQEFGECSGIMMVKGHLHSYFRNLEEEKSDFPVDSPRRKNLNRVLGINIVPNVESQEHTPYLIDSEFEQEAREVLEYGDYIVLNLANGRNEAILQYKNEKKLASLIRKIKRARTLETGYQAAFDYEINDVLKGKVLDQTSDETKQLPIVFNHYDRNVPVTQRRTPLLFIKIDANQTSEELQKVAKVALQEGLDGIVVGSAVEYKDPNKGKTEKLGGSENSSYALNALKEVYKVTQGKMVLVSSGGVFDEKDVLERIENGANLVQIYTSFALGGPYMVQRLIEGLAKETEEKLRVNNLQNLNQLVGIKLRQGK